MYTYTTPTITFNLSGVDFTDVDYVRLAVKGKHCTVIREVEVADIDTEEGTAAMALTQEETAALGAGQLILQARIHYTDGTVQATNRVVKQMIDVIDQEII